MKLFSLFAMMTFIQTAKHRNCDFSMKEEEEEEEYNDIAINHYIQIKKRNSLKINPIHEWLTFIY